MELNRFLERSLTTLESFFYSIFWNHVKRPRDPENQDVVTVFLKKDKDIDKKTGVLRVSAFLPRKFETFETSVFKITGLKEHHIWSLGRRWTVINPWPRKSGQSNIRGRGDISADKVRSITPLQLRVAPSPHPLHANILEWPASESEQMLFSLELASKATVVRFVSKDPSKKA